MKKTFPYGVMALGLIFTACNSDEPLVDNNQGNGVANADQTLYVNMAIRGDVGTRAAADNGSPLDPGDFDNGVNESDVQNAYFVFYDQNGDVVGDIVSVNLGSAVVDGTNTVEKYYKSVVPVSVRKGENNPTQVVCYINPLSPAALQNPLSVAQTVTRQEVTSSANGKTYFPMSNSVYYTSDAATEPQVAVAINADQLYDTREEAAAAGAEAIDIYVERYAAKLKFTAKDAEPYVTNTVIASTGAEVPVTLNFVAERWALNAEANETYAVKSFRQPSETGAMLGTNFTFADLNTRINGTLATNAAWSWNNPTYHRSFWAVSPAYFTEAYPEVGSDVVAGLNQKYYTFAELDNGAGFAADDTEAKYFRETTIGQRALAGGNPAAATPSVILTGSYSISVNGTVAPKNTGFYTYLTSNGKALVYFANVAGSSESAVEGGESMLRRFIAQTTILYKKEGNNYVRYNANDAEDLATLTAALEVAAPLATGEEKFDPNRRTLQFKAGADTEGIYVANGNGYKVISAEAGTDNITMADANKVLRQQVGYAVFYEKGRGFFNIPVKHYGWYRAGNDQKDVTSTHIDWSKVRVGDFGLVRNHSYQVEINKIEGLASGIGGEDIPIVPPADTKEYYVAYKVNILKWAVVPVQKVDL